jgi:hypothetical protein
MAEGVGFEPTSILYLQGIIAQKAQKRHTTLIHGLQQSQTTSLNNLPDKNHHRSVHPLLF